MEVFEQEKPTLTVIQARDILSFHSSEWTFTNRQLLARNKISRGQDRFRGSHEIRILHFLDHRIGDRCRFFTESHQADNSRPAGDKSRGRRKTKPGKEIAGEQRRENHTPLPSHSHELSHLRTEGLNRTHRRLKWRGESRKKLGGAELVSHRASDTVPFFLLVQKTHRIKTKLPHPDQFPAFIRFCDAPLGVGKTWPVVLKGLLWFDRSDHLLSASHRRSSQTRIYR